MHDIGRNGLLQERGQRHQQVNRNVVRLERMSDAHRVVCTLRVTHQDEGAGFSGSALAQDIPDYGRPVVVAGHLDIDALGASLSARLSRPVENTPNQPSAG